MNNTQKDLGEEIILKLKELNEQLNKLIEALKNGGNDETHQS